MGPYHPASRPSVRRYARSVLVCAIGQAFAATALLPGLALAADKTATAAPAARRAYDIPAGPLEAALNRLGREAGILLSFPTDMTAGLQTLGVRGNHAVPEALAVLLQGTGLVAVEQGGGYVLTRRGSTSAPQSATPVAEAATVLPPVIVTASAPRLYETPMSTPVR